MIIADGNSNGDTACRNADENRSIAKSLISKLNLAAESENYASRDDSQISKGNGATTAISAFTVGVLQVKPHLPTHAPFSSRYVTNPNCTSRVQAHSVPDCKQLLTYDKCCFLSGIHYQLLVYRNG
ncbi:hypothetical protein Ancab_035776 [Ancistrocladus abbreviatus]